MRRLILLVVCILGIVTTLSCSEENVTEISSVSEIIQIPIEREVFDDLHKLEQESTIIVEAIAKNKLDQKITGKEDTEHSELAKAYGYSRWEIEVTKICKGQVKVGDKLILLQDYYIEEDTKKRSLVTFSFLDPVKPEQEYILFLKYDNQKVGYWPVGDYEGMYEKPDKSLTNKVKAGTVKESDIEGVNQTGLAYFLPIYTQMVYKYYN